MPVDATFAAPGRFWKGNLHTHSTRPDAARDAEVVCALYRDAGYDFLALTDHFLPAFGFPIVDTRGFRTNRFTTILGAEVHAPATEIGELWHLLAVGLPLDFTKTPPSERAPELAARCIAAGAYVAIAQDVFVNRSYKRSPIELGLFPRRPARKSGRAAPEAPVADGPERQWRSRLCRLAAKAPTDAILAQRSAGEWASPSPGEGSQHLVHRHDAAMRLGAARELGRSDIKRWVREAQQVSRSRLRFSRGGRRCRAIAGAARPREGSSPARAETPRPFWPAARSRARQARGRAGPPGLGRTRPRLPIWLLTPDKARRRHDNGLPWGELFMPKPSRKFLLLGWQNCPRAARSAAHGLIAARSVHHTSHPGFYLFSRHI